MTLFTPQLLLDGVVDGLIIGLLGMGIVLVHRATKVINFAVANMGLIGSGLFADLVLDFHTPFWIALPIALLAGTLFGLLVDRVVIRRLFYAPRVIVLVATIGVAQLALAVVSSLPKIHDETLYYPTVSGAVWHPTSRLQISGTQIAVLVVVPATALGLSWFLNHTLLGTTVKAAADNPELARLQGISPKAVSAAVWSIAGLVSSLCLILISGENRSVTDLATLGPTTLARALAAAVIARMVSFRVAMAAGVGLGLLQAVVQFNWLDNAGLTDALVFVLVLVAVYIVSRSQRADTGAFSFAPKVRPVPERLREIWWVRNIERLTLLLLGVVAVIVPLVVSLPSRHLLYTVILCYAICAVSVTILTGWAGQLSLGQMAFAGLGALTAAALVRGAQVDLGNSILTIHALPFPAAVAIAALLTSALAALLGIGALRVRGLLLAATTFAFGIACEQYLYARPIFMDSPGSGTASFPRSTVFGIDVTSQRAYYYVVLVVLVVVLMLAGRLRRTGIGRTTIGVRDNPSTAAAYTVAAARTKLRAFALGGGIAGTGGALLAAALQSVPTDHYFLSADSLSLVSIVVIGGLGSTTGPVLGALWVVGLPAFFPGNPIVPLLSSSLGLLVLLLYFPGGLVQVGYSARDGLLAWVDKRMPPAPAKTTLDPPVSLTMRTRAPLPAGRPVLATSEIRVRFGGVTAVDGVSIEVHADEIVGLIGTNGAGKSTLMNAIGGFLPAAGRVDLLGRDVSGLAPHKRAALGLGRTFQAATLFPELTVSETVQIALEARGRSGLLSTALLLPKSIRGERAKRADAHDLIDFLGLGRYADAFIGELSTGTRRIVELAGLLALDARVLCLDEPTAGVAQRETEAFGPLIREVRREMGASMLIIEHDMPLIMGISDRVYCLETGRIIAAGEPATVRHDPRVVASYLGIDERAITRSGTVPPPPSPVAAPAETADRTA
ncbi:ABC transporter permease subunit [Catenulispora rubra]|uniref:ABC transporter permease subunit n=1 Tax=Catenulispora rubra TaxID=280293 RepID=UPI001892772C|nr:ATP-binding cassette domain-containing protein [Catenulispora rubra]